MNLWNQPGIPHLGWRLAAADDLGAPTHVCEMCGQEEIRYVHHVEHDAHAPLAVGCVCAEKMTGDRVTPRRIERQLKSRGARRERWLSRQWRPTHSGNLRLRHKGCVFVVVPMSDGRFRASWKDGGIWHNLRGRWDSSDGAMLGLFDAFEQSHV